MVGLLEFLVGAVTGGLVFGIIGYVVGNKRGCDTVREVLCETGLDDALLRHIERF
jgi:uncharacterized membrane protein